MAEPVSLTCTIDMAIESEKTQWVESVRRNANSADSRSLMVVEALGVVSLPSENSEGHDRRPESPPVNIDVPYSIWSRPQKLSLVAFASISAFLSPVSGLIYFPALDAISKDLHISPKLANVSIATFMVGLPECIEDARAKSALDLPRNRTVIPQQPG